MIEPIRVLHFADVHIGMENYGKTDPESGVSTRVLDFLRRMDQMIAYARQHEVDLVIFAGDAFKTRSPNPTHQREFAWRVRDLAALAPTVLLVGNHDLAPNASKASSIEIYDTLAVPNVWVAQDYTVQEIMTKRGAVIVGTAPYPIRSRLMQHLQEQAKTIRETDDLLEQVLTALLQELAAKANELASGREIPRLLTGHFTVRGAMLSSERSVMLGRDVQVALGLVANPCWDYVALGHIHKHQNLTHGRIGAPPVVYSGSLERIDFGEEGDPKGFCWVELSREETRWQFVEMPVRPMLTMSLDCRHDLAPTQRLLTLIHQHDLREAIVRLRLQFTPETESLFREDEVRRALYQAGAFHVAGIRRDVERPERTRLGDNPTGLSQDEILERYFIAKGIDEERRRELLEAARTLMPSELGLDDDVS